MKKLLKRLAATEEKPSLNELAAAIADEIMKRQDAQFEADMAAMDAADAAEENAIRVVEKSMFADGPEGMYAHAGHAIKSAVAALEQEVPGYDFLIVAASPFGWRFDLSRSLPMRGVANICTELVRRAVAAI